MKNVIKAIYLKIIVYGRMIKFEHTVFALPFSLAALLLAHRVSPVTPSLVFWIIMAGRHGIQPACRCEVGCKKSPYGRT